MLAESENPVMCRLLSVSTKKDLMSAWEEKARQRSCGTQTGDVVRYYHQLMNSTHQTDDDEVTTRKFRQIGPLLARLSEEQDNAPEDVCYSDT